MLHRQAERLGCHLRDDGTRADAEILRAELDDDLPSGIDRRVAIAGVPAAAPGADGEPDAVFTRPVEEPAASTCLFQSISSAALLELPVVGVGARREIEIPVKNSTGSIFSFWRQIVKALQVRYEACGWFGAPPRAGPRS